MSRQAAQQQRNRTRWALTALAPVVLLALSCTKESVPAAADADEEKDTGIAKTYERGPVTVRLNTSRSKLTIADRLELRIEVEAEEDYEIELPGFGDKLEQFGIVDYRTSQPKLVEDNRVLTTRSYTLEPFLSGDYKIPPMKIQFRKKGEEDNTDKTHEIETDELTIEVASLLPEQVAELKIEDIAPPVPLPRPAVVRHAPLIAGGAALVILAGVLVWLRCRSKKGEGVAAPKLPAHVIAYSELRALVAEDLVAQGEVKLFYLRISIILRRYIENRFGLHAPERTTEEFLAELGAASEAALRGAFRTEHRDLLRGFLTHCDLVKFAEHQPGEGEIQSTFDSCKTFVEQTKTEAGQEPAEPGGQSARAA